VCFRELVKSVNFEVDSEALIIELLNAGKKILISYTNISHVFCHESLHYG